MTEALAGRLPVQTVWGFVERLMDEPWSRHRAKLIGGDHWREHLGWGPAEYLTATLVDAVQVNTAVTAVHGSKQRPKVPEPYPRPDRQKPPPEPVEPVEDETDLQQLVDLING